MFGPNTIHTPLYRKMIVRNMGPLVQNFGFKDTSHFNNFLQATDLTLSGSLMLQCIVGEKWEGDMDLYLSYPHRKRRYQPIREMLDLIGYKPNYIVKSYSHFSPVFKCIGFSNGVRNIQVIVIDRSHSVLTAVLKFDFSYLSNMYSYDGESKITIWDPNSITTRTSSYKNEYQQLLIYITKFMQFNTETLMDKAGRLIRHYIQDQDAKCRQMAKFVEKCMSREVKYYNRGFHLDFKSLELLNECNESIMFRNYQRQRLDTMSKLEFKRK